MAFSESVVKQAWDRAGGKWVVVVGKRADRRFISTVYATDWIKSGEVLWPKK